MIRFAVLAVVGLLAVGATGAGIAYARRLEAGGNTVELADYPGMVHPFFSMGGAVDAGRRAVTLAAQALRGALGAEP